MRAWGQATRGHVPYPTMPPWRRSDLDSPTSRRTEAGTPPPLKAGSKVLKVVLALLVISLLGVGAAIAILLLGGG
jgi:hypothetical protein